VAAVATFALRGAVKRFGGGAGLGPIDLDVPSGRTTAVIGPSGCGKSTLLRLLLGLVPPDAGTVEFDGAPVDERSRLRMGYVIQDGGLFPHMTAAANATVMARWLDWAPARIAARLDELVALTRFPPDGLARYPAELSGGQRQRVGLMRALMLDPQVLLLDEPLGALDPLVRADLQAELGAVVRTVGKTAVLVTHDLGEAGLLGDRVVLLRDGRIVQEGPLRALVEQPADPFVTRFVRAQRGPLEVLS
jgi:osmoprotectant transport system ATP-binding protein